MLTRVGAYAIINIMKNGYPVVYEVLPAGNDFVDSDGDVKPAADAQYSIEQPRTPDQIFASNMLETIGFIEAHMQLNELANAGYQNYATKKAGGVTECKKLAKKSMSDAFDKFMLSYGITSRNVNEAFERGEGDYYYKLLPKWFELRKIVFKQDERYADLVTELECRAQYKNDDAA